MPDLRWSDDLLPRPGSASLNMELVSNCGDWSRHFLIHQSAAGQTGVCSDNISSIMFAEPDHKAASHFTAAETEKLYLQS